MPFSEKSLSFLFENRVCDSRTWFLEHREDYEVLVLTPLRELVTRLQPFMWGIDPFIICEPKIGKSISRIYRDTRFSHDKSIFRDHMWCVFQREKRHHEGPPGFYFEITPAGYSFGCGWYRTPPETLAQIRDMVKRDDKLYIEAGLCLKRDGRFYLEDTRYKRSRSPEQPEEKRLWLDQRSLCAVCDGEDMDMLFSGELAEYLAGGFEAIAPFYRFLLEADSRARG